MSVQPFDPDNPPEEPPPACEDRLMWRMAYSLHVAHQPDVDGFCLCRQFYPCSAAHLAARGLLAACQPVAVAVGAASEVGVGVTE